MTDSTKMCEKIHFIKYKLINHYGKRLRVHMHMLRECIVQVHGAVRVPYSVLNPVDKTIRG